MSTLLVDKGSIQVKVKNLSDYALRRELERVRAERMVAELHKNESLLVYLDAYFEAMAIEVGTRGIDAVKRAEPGGGYSLSAKYIRERVNLAEVIGRYTHLRQLGSNRLVGLCPLHTERVPSFFVYTERNDFYCFGCGRGGDIFNFLMFYEDCSFFEALQKANSLVAGSLSASLDDIALTRSGSNIGTWFWPRDTQYGKGGV